MYIKPIEVADHLHEIRVTGLGGQGVILTTHIMGVAAMLDNLEALQIQKYGPENRGSRVFSHLIIAPEGEKIWFPVVVHPTFLCAMAQVGYDKSIKKMKHKGIVLYDADTIKPIDNHRHITQIPFPGSRIAIEMKSKIVTNIVFLGGMIAILNFISIDSVEKAIRQVVNPRFHELNVKALKMGYEEMQKILKK